jgi:hypothetical protein
MAGTVVTQSAGHTEKTVVIHWSAMAMATKNTLRDHLENTVKYGGTVSVTPDSGDDLEVGASGATNFTYMGFRATYVKGGYYAVDVTLRKIT